MEKKSIKITQPQQFDRLIALLQEQPVLAGVKAMSFPKKVHHAKWENVATELNKFGPPTRTAREWQRVWIHHKSKLKRKLARQVSGSLDSLNLTHMEKSVKGIVDLQNAVFPKDQDCDRIQSETTLSLPNEVENVENISPIEQNAEKYDIVPKLTSSKTMSNLKMHSKSVNHDKRITCVDKQTDNLKEILETLKKIERLMLKSYDLNKQMFELKKKKSLEASELHSLKIQLTKRKILWLDIQLRNAN